MNALNFSANVKQFYMTPFKFSVCCLIHSFLKDKELGSKYNVLMLLDGVRLLVNEYQCEINISILYNRLKSIITELCITNNLQSQSEGIFEYIKSVLGYYYKSINSINSLYVFFNNNIRKLETKDEHNTSILEAGGFIYSYIRKCLFAFYKMKFEDLCKFYQNLRNYLNCEDLHIQMTNRESEEIFRKQLDDFTFSMNNPESILINEKILASHNYKHKYYFFAKQDKSIASLSNSHKFFDYNMKYFYNDISQADTKIHYSLLNIVEYCYENNFYNQAIQVLIECIKLTQSSWDHAGLLKCFLWLEKIYRNLGQVEIASKCLATCLVKSFENNYHLLYLISSCEMAHLNFIYFPKQPVKSSEDNLSVSVEEKILSYSDYYNYSYKNVLQFLSLNKSDYIYPSLEKPLEYFKYVQLTTIFNLLRNGKISLALSFIKIFADVYKDSNNKETIEILLNLLYETLEFDLGFCIDLIYHIYNRFSESKDFAHVIDLIKIKFLALSGRSFAIEPNKLNKLKNQVYYQVTFDYYKLYAQVISNVYHLSNEQDLLQFRQVCKKFSINRFKHFASFLLASVYMSQKRMTEAYSIVNKVIDKADDMYTIFKGKLMLSKINTKMNKIEEVRKLVTELNLQVNKLGSLPDKYDFYSIKCQISMIDKSNEIPWDLFNLLKSAILIDNLIYIKNSFVLIRMSLAKEKTVMVSSVLEQHVVSSEMLNKLVTNFDLEKSKEIEVYKIIQYHSNKVIDQLKDIIIN